MELEEKIKYLSKEKLLGIRKLTPIGGSYSFTIPRLWVTMHCTEIEGDYYVKLRVIEDELIFSPIDPSEVENITIRRKEG